MDNTELEKFDLAYPGHWIAGLDRDWASQTAHILSLAEHEFIQAVACFAKFEPVTRENVKQFVERTPSKYTDCLNTVYARSFVYALNSVGTLLNALRENFYPPDSVKLLISEYEFCFANLKYIRNSSMHIEDRGRGVVRKRGKESKILTNILLLGSFNERCFDFTGEDGKIYGVEISESTLLSVHRILQAIINAYTWE
jgi:hypothetical protein